MPFSVGRREIVHRVVSRFLQEPYGPERVAGEQHRIAIRRRLGGSFKRDHAARLSTMTGRPNRPVISCAMRRREIAAPSPILGDDTDGLAGIVLRKYCAGA